MMWEDRQTERWRGNMHDTSMASWRAATHQFLSEPGDSFVDTPEAFQLVCGQWPVTSTGTPGRWKKLSGFP